MELGQLRSQMLGRGHPHLKQPSLELDLNLNFILIFEAKLWHSST